MRGLKYDGRYFYQSSPLSRPAGVRGLKLSELYTALKAGESRPAGVRGLKYHVVFFEILNALVAPHSRDVQIERILTSNSSLISYCEDKSRRELYKYLKGSHKL